MSVFRDLWWFFKQEKRSYLVGFFALIILAILELVPAWMVGRIIDLVNTKQLTYDHLLQYALILIGFGILAYVCGYLWRISIFGAAHRLGKLLRDRLYKSFTKMSPQFYHKQRIGDMMAHSTNDIQAVTMTAGEGVMTLTDTVVLGGLVIGTMAITIDWQLTILAILPLPILAYCTNRYGTLLHKRFHLAQKAFSTMNDKVQESMAGVRVIKAFGQEDDEKKEFGGLLDDVVQKNVAVARVDGLYDPTIIILMGISTLITIAVGTLKVLDDTITVGQLTQFTVLLGRLIWPMLAFGWLFNIVEKGRASYDRVNALLTTEPQIQDLSDAVAEIPSGDIEYKVKQFQYPEAGSQALKDVQFSLKKGQTLGIVGKTGSGKTTLFRLLLREFEGSQAQVLIKDKPIDQYQMSYLRRAIGYVPQDHILFSANIAENIAFGNPDATREQIEAAAKVACIHEDIMQLPQGYETVVGERGVTLSGGQKQRVSIARALLLNPEVLILDDSLSAVDAKTEHSILHELRMNRSDKTTMIAAHRLSAVEEAELILVMEDGRIAERGTHEELMNLDGWYREMYESQQLESLIMEGGK
ncbi:ABC transporter transmembrane domain-containing protein [Thermoactinomyces sp. DSM 45892]|uniref:ABC transporter transmembrane domain-containing protein n=1 Tax=Thermoactinomyces sp. DSM 45892 TaxID=1882753 RepID=UPI00089D46FA|nr:ABC transporter transmembrane domain-containing protein [Thermoactinomyces sp. DSM 45892]SDY02555.1 ATP-binding cassette, subfamily B [Thermoactinomyces sp. DSM 45892]